MEHLLNWLNMEGYGVFLWAAYGVALGGLLCLWAVLRYFAKKIQLKTQTID